MRVDFEWQEAPGVRDKVLAATWAKFSLCVDDRCASEAIDLRSNSRRTSINGSLFPLAVWFVENWWHLTHEPAPRTPVPGGRVALPLMRNWIQRHNLLAAREGGALPDLTIMREGNEILIQWEADPELQHPPRLRFIGQGRQSVRLADFERSVGLFIDAVIARLEDDFSGNEDVARVIEAWSAIRLADPAEAELCQSLAVMGVDPYDPDEAQDSLIQVVERCIEILPGELRSDLLEASGPQSLASNLEWVDRERGVLRREVNGAKFPTISPVIAPTPHGIGYLTASRVRSELLGMSDDSPIQDLTSVLVDKLGWTSGCLRPGVTDAPLDGMVGLDDATSSLVLVTAGRRSKPAERFRLARAAYFPVSRSLGSNARLLSHSVNPAQRAARAFAAELLAPAAALASRAAGRLNDQDVEHLATEFDVGPEVIRRQVENHRLGYLET